MPVAFPAQEASPRAGLTLKILALFSEVGGALEALSRIYLSSYLVLSRVTQARVPVVQLGVRILNRA
jgi:hypothetical protein